MQLNAQNRADFEAKFNQLQNPTKEFLLGCCVALNAAPFRASGLIFTFDKAGNPFILTAKHNLLQGAHFEPDGKPKPSALVNAFTDKITIEYGPTNFTTRPPRVATFDKAPNNGENALIFGGKNQDSWTYDVMMVKSVDPGLSAWAKGHALIKSQLDANALGLMLSTPTLAVKRTKGHEYIQVGFGFSSTRQVDTDPHVGRFQVRFPDLVAAGTVDRIYGYDEESETDDVNISVARITADNANSSAPGDSGGPLFLLDSTSTGNDPPKVFLIGVTLGANYSLTERTPIPDDPILMNVSSYVRLFLCESTNDRVEGC